MAYSPASPEIQDSNDVNVNGEILRKLEGIEASVKVRLFSQITCPLISFINETLAVFWKLFPASNEFTCSHL